MIIAKVSELLTYYGYVLEKDASKDQKKKLEEQLLKVEQEM